MGETALTAIRGFEKTALLIRSHTEYYDGSGFPDKLEGNNVRAGARIIRAARDFISLQTGVMSKKRLNADEAFSFIHGNSGKKYDPNVVKCLEHFRKGYDVSERYSNEVETDSRRLLPGMVLTKDLLNSRELLLVSKGHVLDEAIISKIIGMEISEKSKFTIFVSKEKNKINSSTNEI